MFFCKILGFGKFKGTDFKLDKLEDDDFKYDNSFFKFLPKSTQIRHFWSQIWAFSFFSRIFAIRQTQECRFQISQYHFQIAAQKYPKQAF